jgi:hypothetical protein
MSDQPNPNFDPQGDDRSSERSAERGKDPQRPLSEISHLFLSSIRDRQTNGASRPVRKPPTNTPANGPATGAVPAKPIEPAHSIDLTPEEFAQVYGGGQPIDREENRPNVTAVIAAHLNGRQVDRVREYAAHLASAHGRIGLIELDASEFRLMLFERRPDGATSDLDEAAFNAPERLDPKRMTEALEELNWDVDRWLLLLPVPRGNEARELLRAVDRWTLLATCDHDGMVSAYRTLKGLADLRSFETGNPAGVHPKLSLALLDVRSHDEADRVSLKLAGVCQQFLNWELESEALVKPAAHVADHQVLCCRAGKETVAGTPAPQFAVVHEFLNRAEPTMATEIEPGIAAAPVAQPASAPQIAPSPVAPSLVAAMPVMPASVAPAPVTAAPAISAPTMQTPFTVAPVAAAPAAAVQSELRLVATDAPAEMSDVIDLPGDDSNPAAVVSAVLRGSNSLAETPLKAPSCPGASLAVSRDRKLVLVAVARQGLCDLRDIATAYRWMSDNRPLIAMALPQFAIEPTQSPRLQLLVSQSDLSAEMLQPLLQSGNVTVQTYRKLRWGGKTGLLLEAA